MREQQELLVIVLLRLQRALDRRKLCVKADALLLEALHDLLVRLADT